LDDDSVIIYPAVKISGVDAVTVNHAKIAGLDPDFIVEPTRVDMGINVPVEDTAIAVNGLEQEDPTHGAPMAPNFEPATSPEKTRSPAKARRPVPTHPRPLQHTWPVAMTNILLQMKILPVPTFPRLIFFPRTFDCLSQQRG
jgi:hypothetical protein